MESLLTFFFLIFKIFYTFSGTSGNTPEPMGNCGHAHTYCGAYIEKLKCHDTQVARPHPGQKFTLQSGCHLLIGNMKMLSHGLGSGCHGDSLFKFAFSLNFQVIGPTRGSLARTAWWGAGHHAQLLLVHFALHLYNTCILGAKVTLLVSVFRWMKLYSLCMIYVSGWKVLNQNFYMDWPTWEMSTSCRY